MNVLLTHTYFLNFDDKAHKQMQPYPPLGTLYAASMIRKHGYEPAFFDAMLAGDEIEITPLIEQHHPDVVVFFEDNFNYLSKMCLSRMREACYRMAAIAKKHGALVIAQGSDPVDHLEEYFANGIDYVIIGEGEVTLVELLDRLSGKTSTAFNDIQGIAFQDNGSIVRTIRREVLHGLDTLPFPAWDLVDMEKYRTLWMEKHGYFSLNLVTTRGCPYHCNWCAKPVYGQVYNARSAANVAEEQLLLKWKYGAQHIWFADDIFGLKPGWVAQYADAIDENGARLPFKIQSRADLLLQENTIRNLARSGCDEVWIGAESGSQKILDAMDKGITVEQIYESTRLMRQSGIHVAFFLQYGYTGETMADIALTRKMVRELIPDNIGISVSYPLPGTKFYERVAAQLGEKKNWKTSGDLDLMYQSTYSGAFYRALHAATHKEYRMRQSLRNWLQFPQSIGKHFRSMIALPWYVAGFVVNRVRMLVA